MADQTDGSNRVYSQPAKPLSKMTDDEIRKLAGELFDAIQPDDAIPPVSE